MNRLNKQGALLLDYKVELSKDYPPLVRDAILTTLSGMKSERKVTEEAFVKIADKKIDTDAFRSFLLTQRDYSKSEEEIFEELETMRKDLFRELPKGMFTSKSLLAKEEIQINRPFYLDERFAREYFHVDEKDILTLMKRKGMVERFAFLRLPKILGGFLAKTKKDLPNSRISYSPVYYEAEGDRYAIDLTFIIPADLLEPMVEYTEVTNRIIDMATEASAYVKERLMA